MIFHCIRRSLKPLLGLDELSLTVAIIELAKNLSKAKQHVGEAYIFLLCTFLFFLLAHLSI
jgi:hypothetical protein